MKILIENTMIPGTILSREQMDGLTGKAFLNRVFYVSDGVMLAQIRKIAGIDGSTLQNWTKRGWVASSPSKRYDMDQVAHILLINMLRSCVQLDRIAWLLQYVNGDINDESDDIIRETELYDLICMTLDRLEYETLCTGQVISGAISDVLRGYNETVVGARERLANALEIIVGSYCAALIKRGADARMAVLSGEGGAESAQA